MTIPFFERQYIQHCGLIAPVPNSFHMQFADTAWLKDLSWVLAIDIDAVMAIPLKSTFLMLISHVQALKQQYIFTQSLTTPYITSGLAVQPQIAYPTKPTPSNTLLASRICPVCARMARVLVELPDLILSWFRDFADCNCASPPALCRESSSNALRLKWFESGSTSP